MNTYWANFAKTGDPNGPGLPAWPRYESSGGEILEVNRAGVAEGKPDTTSARLDLIRRAVETQELH